jgi:hypothetical protein
MQRRLLLAAPLFLLSTPAPAQGTRRDPFEGDARVQRSARITAEGISLGELLPQISRTAGVKLSVSRELADEKALLFGPVRPLRDVLNDLATLFNARWTRAGSRTPEYELAQDLAQRQYETRLLRASAEAMLLQLEEQVRALHETPEQLARRPANDPVRRIFEVEKTRTATHVYALLGPQHREQLFATGFLKIPFAAFSPEQQAGLRKVFEGVIERDRERNEEFMREHPGQSLSISRPEELETYGVIFHVDRQGGRVSASMRLGNTGNFYLASLSTGIRLLPAQGNPFTGKGVTAEDLPHPEEASVAAREQHWVDRLRKLSELSGAAVVSDYYRGRPVTNVSRQNPPPEALTDPPAAMDALCAGAGYLWWTEGKTLLFRKRDYFVQRQFEPPDRWMAEAAAALAARTGAVTLEDVLRVQELTPKQVAGLNNLVREHATDERFNRDTHPLLALLASSGRPRSAPLYAADLGPDMDTEEKSALVEFGPLNARQQQLVAQLQAQLEGPIDPEVWKGQFGIKAFAAKAAEKTQSGYRYQWVGLKWRVMLQVTPRFGRGQAGLLQQLYLPLSIPDDRRGRTRVELTP